MAKQRLKGSMKAFQRHMDPEKEEQLKGIKLDGVKNPTEVEEIYVICQAEFEHEESIGTLGCRHEYHMDCIKQGLLKKKDCPMCPTCILP
ncbi:hypothetical protein H5410_062870 [Solanum commersonii]|uniref:RING-type E3 ubiquitin transferase n=1 Tax=Solanum commersonii TaxID=4109 RepID=A0A9J5WDL7_SOLCO|nr:hypothetical protein H5410_062870 [Solanum commersonii]